VLGDIIFWFDAVLGQVVLLEVEEEITTHLGAFKKTGIRWSAKSNHIDRKTVSEVACSTEGIKDRGILLHWMKMVFFGDL
jgi:hypothetical protein